MAATVVHFSPTGFQISPCRTALVSSSPWRVPPTAITWPSARTTRLWRRRGEAMEAASFQAGEAGVVSVTAAFARAGSPPPARRIFPVPHMAQDSAYPLEPELLVGPSA